MDDNNNNNNNNNNRPKGNIFPLIYSLLCLCVTAGGVCLVIYVFFPALSRSWQPVTALILIGSPWLVWTFTYIYACAKGCCLNEDSTDRQIPIRQMRSTCASTVSEQKGGAGAGTHNDGGHDYAGSFDSSGIP